MQKVATWLASQGLWTKRNLASSSAATRKAAIDFLAKTIRATGTIPTKRLAKYPLGDVREACGKVMDAGIFNAFVLKRVPWREIVDHSQVPPEIQTQVFEQALKQPGLREEDFLAILRHSKASKPIFELALRWSSSSRSGQSVFEKIMSLPNFPHECLDSALGAMVKHSRQLPINSFEYLINHPNLSLELQRQAFLERLGSHPETLGHPKLPPELAAAFINKVGYDAIALLDFKKWPETIEVGGIMRMGSNGEFFGSAMKVDERPEQLRVWESKGIDIKVLPPTTDRARFLADRGVASVEYLPAEGRVKKWFNLIPPANQARVLALLNEDLREVL